jgi:hypothetical protein
MPQSPVRLDKRFLHHVFGLGRIVDEARDQAHQPALILPDQQVERLPVTGLDALNQQLITLAFCRH